MLNVAIVIPQLTYGGTERQVAILSAGLLRDGRYNPIVLSITNHINPHANSLTEAGVTWEASPTSRVKKLGRLLWLVAAIRRHDCKLVYGILNVGNIYGGMGARLLGLPFIGSIRNADVTLPLGLRSISRFFCQRADHVITNSTSCTEFLRNEFRVLHARVTTIPNAVVASTTAMNNGRGPRSEWGIPEDALVIGTVALLKKQKRPRFFIEVCDEVLRSAERTTSPSKPIHFVWVGSGPEKRAVDLLLQGDERLAQRVHFVGMRDDVTECLRAMDCFILTSEYEGMPNALLEAMSMGLPSLVTDVPGNRDIVSETQGGELGDAYDAGEFADHLLSLIRDMPRMQILGRRAKTLACERFSEDKLVQSHCEVFSSALSHRSIGFKE